MKQLRWPTLAGAVPTQCQFRLNMQCHVITQGASFSSRNGSGPAPPSGRPKGRECRQGQCQIRLTMQCHVITQGASFSSRNGSGPATPSGRPERSSGERPVKVAAHGKIVKELTDLALIQELNAHNGARFPSLLPHQALALLQDLHAHNGAPPS